MRFATRAGWIGLLISAFGCAQPAPAAKTAAAPATVPVVPSSAPAASAALPQERPEWRRHFEALHISGTTALFDTQSGILACSDVALCQRAVLPASTFKIPNSMIGLELGILEDAETRLPWDGKQYDIPEWNRDNDLRTAIRVSCVPCYQAIARQVGTERMQEWVNRLDYGNHDISGGIDHFWLRGGMRISPLQQVEFLRRFEAGKLPISPRTAEIVRDIMTLDVGPDHVLLGKTGLQVPPNATELTAWFVGFVELGQRRVFFATLVNRADHGVDVKPLRRRVTESILREVQALPADAARAPAE
ncbi:MAG: penicillin-binding transpeptidase domain-containing protein [Myxococcota bacterium]